MIEDLLEPTDDNDGDSGTMPMRSRVVDVELREATDRDLGACSEGSSSKLKEERLRLRRVDPFSPDRSMLTPSTSNSWL